jgi:hypothetical protein
MKYMIGAACNAWVLHANLHAVHGFCMKFCMRCTIANTLRIDATPYLFYSNWPLHAVFFWPFVHMKAEDNFNCISTPVMVCNTARKTYFVDVTSTRQWVH